MSRLGKKDIGIFRQRLLGERADLLRRIGTLDADIQALDEERETDFADQAQESALASLLGGFEDHERARLLEIQGALDRIARNTYGICERCRAPITRARLVVVPATAHCVGCHRDLEIRAAEIAASSD